MWEARRRNRPGEFRPGHVAELSADDFCKSSFPFGDLKVGSDQASGRGPGLQGGYFLILGAFGRLCQELGLWKGANALPLEEEGLDEEDRTGHRDIAYLRVLCSVSCLVLRDEVCVGSCLYVLHLIT